MPGTRGAPKAKAKAKAGHGKITLAAKARAQMALAKIDEGLERKEKDEQMENDILEIICELYAHPEKIARCKRNVLSDTFLMKAEKADDWDTPLNASYRTIKRLPRYIHVALGVEVAEMDRDASTECLEVTFKQVKGFQHQFVCYSTLTRPEDHFPTTDKRELLKLLVARAKQYGSLGNVILQWLCANQNEEVGWRSMGFFSPMAGDDPQYYDKVEFRPTSCQVALPSYMRVKMTEWTLEDNWNLFGAKLVMDGAKQNKMPPILFKPLFDAAPDSDTNLPKRVAHLDAGEDGEQSMAAEFCTPEKKRSSPDELVKLPGMTSKLNKLRKALASTAKQ